MKFMLLAAAAVLAAPAIAQTTPATPDQTMPAPADPAADQTMPADQAMPEDQTMPAQAPMAGSSMPATGASGTMSPGGYMPSGPAITGGTPGATPMFRAAPSPSEAFPPPAPKDSYPPCKKGQFDGCTNPGGK